MSISHSPTSRAQGAVVYEVSITANPEIAEEYAAWLDGHIGGVLALPGFESAVLFVDGDVSPEEGAAPKWIVQYRLTDRAAFDRYLAEDAARMRADGQERFGDQFRAERRVFIEQKRFGV
jgi:hypothetical protein